MYLGCNQKCFTLLIESGSMAFVMAYDVKKLLGTCVDKYIEY